MKSMHSAVPVKKGIKWNATRFLYDSTKKCSTEAASEIMVPKAVFENKPQEDSMKTMFGTTLPKGVLTGPQGTVDSSLPPEPDDDDAFDMAGVDDEDDTPEW